MRQLIGLFVLLHFRCQVMIGRGGLWLAWRYGAVGIGGAFDQLDRELAIRARYGLPDRPPAVQ